MCSLCAKTVIAPKRRVSKGGNGYCPGYEDYLNRKAAGTGTAMLPKGKRCEVVVREALLPLVVDEKGIPFSPEMVDDMRNMLGNINGKRKWQCDTQQKRRIDILFIIRDPETNRITHFLIVEIDEDSHVTRSPVCELSRLDDIVQCLNTLAHQEFKSRLAVVDWESHVPIILTFRFNPDRFDGPKVVTREERIKTLASFCRSFLQSPPGRDEYDPNVMHVKCFFYHSKQGRANLDALQEAHSKGSIIYHGNVTEALPSSCSDEGALDALPDAQSKGSIIYHGNVTEALPASCSDEGATADDILYPSEEEDFLYPSEEED